MSTSQVPQVFHLFTALPFELQLKIWQAAITSIPSRVVTVPNLQARGRFLTTQPHCPLTSACSIPAVLHASRASRSLALQRWRLSFHYLPVDNIPRIFFDFSGDIFWLQHQLFYSLPTLKQLDSADLQAVRRVAITLQEWWDAEFDYGRGLAEQIHKLFPGAEELIIAGSPESSGRPDRDRKKTQIRLVGYEKGNGEGHEYEQKAITDAFLERHRERAWTRPTLGHCDYVRYERDDIGELS
jgi:2EXR family